MMGLEGKKKGKEQRTPSQGCANLKKRKKQQPSN